MLLAEVRLEVRVDARAENILIIGEARNEPEGDEAEWPSSSAPRCFVRACPLVSGGDAMACRAQIQFVPRAWVTKAGCATNACTNKSAMGDAEAQKRPTPSRAQQTRACHNHIDRIFPNFFRTQVVFSPDDFQGLELL